VKNTQPIFSRTCCIVFFRKHPAESSDPP